MSCDYRLYLEDFLASCEKILQHDGEMTMDPFLKDDKTSDAVARKIIYFNMGILIPCFFAAWIASS
jgi:uncharacterized protein with HEPN domain